jgi:hypothetical protein
MPTLVDLDSVTVSSVLDFIVHRRLSLQSRLYGLEMVMRASHYCIRTELILTCVIPYANWVKP